MNNGEVSVRVYSGVHKEGTKEYTLINIKGKDGNIVVASWGPVGKEIGAKVTRELFSKKDTSVDSMLMTRRSKGYDMVQHGTTIQTDIFNLGDILTARQLKELSDTDVSWLLKGMSRRDIRGTPQAASVDMADQMLQGIKEQRAIQLEREKAEDEASLKSNPLFGMF